MFTNALLIAKLYVPIMQSLDKQILLRFSSFLPKKLTFFKSFSTDGEQRIIVDDIKNEKESDYSRPSTFKECQKKIKNMKPSEAFLEQLNDSQLSKVNFILKELEIFFWVSGSRLNTLTSQQWDGLLNRNTLKDRVSYLLYQESKLLKTETENKKKEEVEAMYAAEKMKFDRGEMGYGPQMYQLVSPSMLNNKRLSLHNGSKLWMSMRIKEKPHILFDMTYFEKSAYRRKALVCETMVNTIATNFSLNHPFQLNFANFFENNAHPEREKIVDKLLSTYTSQYADQKLLPLWTSRSICDLYPKLNRKDVIYFSGKSMKIYDGPLRHKLYVICGDMEFGPESLAAARKQGFETYRLPIDRYVKWKSGKKMIPFPNLIKVLDEVYHSNGDWKTAFLKNIAKHYLTYREDKPNADVLYAAYLEKVNRRDEIIKLVSELIEKE